MADVWRYRTDIGGLPGGPGLMTLHFNPTDGSPSPQDCVDAVETFLSTVDTFISSSIAFTGSSEMEVLDVANGEQTASEAVTPFAVPGVDSATMLPPINQVLIRWNTSLYLGGRRLQGKTFLPGLCEDSNEPGGVVQTAVADAIQAAAVTLNTSDVGLCVFSRTKHAIAGISTINVWNKWAILAGRRDG